MKELHFVASNGQYVFKDNLVNENLTMLIIWACDCKMTDDIPKLLAACKSLNWFETSMQIEAADLEAILKYQPKLTKLFLNRCHPCLSPTCIKKHKEKFGQNLLEFSCQFERLGKKVTEKLLQTAFANNFKNIKVLRTSNGYFLKMYKDIPI